MTRRTLLAVVLLGLIPSPAPAQDAPDDVDIVEHRKIWDYAAHNAFTDLIRFNGKWLCTFREGNGHVSPDGAIRVLHSFDGVNWSSLARIADPKADLRDPKLCITPEGKLMLNAVAATPKEKVKHRSKVWFSADGKAWDDGHTIGEDDVWLWRVTWHGKTAYGVGYHTAADGKTRFARLYKSADGVKWETLVDKFVTDDSPNESSLLFNEDGSALCLVRREEGSKSALLGTSKPPYDQWKWKDLGVRIGGPALTRLKDGRLTAVVRLYDNKVRTAVCAINAVEGTLTELATLPSGGDTSYAGLVEDDGYLYVSYYSSHEKKTSIYLAKVKIWKGARPEPPSPF